MAGRTKKGLGRNVSNYGKKMNYNQIDKLSKEYIQKKIKEFLQEDMPKGDITTDNIYKNEQIEAQIIAT